MNDLGSAKGRSLSGRAVEHDLELWKHYAAIGGEDKNRMATIASWLLGFSAAIHWGVAAHLAGTGEVLFDNIRYVRMTSSVGIVIAITAAYVSLLYGGYSNQNWQRADEIATSRKWLDLVPDYSRKQTWSLNRLLDSIAKSLARPCDPQRRLAPVFIAFFLLAVASMLIHLLTLALTTA
jgi:hypothetical protein